MAEGLFIVGFTKAEVLAIQAKAKEQLIAGKTLMEWDAGDTRVKKEQAMPIRDVLRECAYALQAIEPETYGSPVTRTVPRYL